MTARLVLGTARPPRDPSLLWALLIVAGLLWVTSHSSGGGY